MARLPFAIGQAGISTGTAAKTLLQILAPANQRLAVKRISVGFHGIVNTDAPILVRILRQTTAGTMSGATVVNRNSLGTETLQTTAFHTASAEPTAGDVLYRTAVHPQSGLILDGEEFIIPGGGRLGVEVTAGVSVAADVEIEGEE